MSDSTDASFQFPVPFDNPVSFADLSESCYIYFKSIIADQGFLDCYPMSVYLTNSQSYSDIVRVGPAAVRNVLEAACSVDTNKCNQIMASTSRNMFQNDTCLPDYNNGVNAALQAFNAISAYEIVQKATCLKYDYMVVANDSNNSAVATASTGRSQSNINIEALNSTHNLQASGDDTSNPDHLLYNYTVPTNATLSDKMSSYCYLSAIYKDLDDGYLYLLPLGYSYPNSSTIQPTCLECNKKLMKLYYNYTGNSSNTISITYESASSILDNVCGANFVDEKAKEEPKPTKKKNAATSVSVSMSAALFYLLIIFPFLAI